MPTPRSTEPSSRRSPTSTDDDRLHHLARAGYVAYGVVYLLIAWLAVQLAIGDRSGTPSSSGALRELAQQPFGQVLVWLVTIGMFLLAIWKVAEAILGDDGAGKRVLAGGKAVMYTVIGISGVSVALGSGSSGSSGKGGGGGGGGGSEETWTAKLMNLPGGQLLVGVVALAIIGYGLYEGYKAWTDKYAEELTQEGKSGATGSAYLWFGKIGTAARGVAIVVVGGLFAYAAITHDAKKSGGLDQALYEVLDMPFGPVLLCLIGLGLGCYGLFTLARAKHFEP